MYLDSFLGSVQGRKIQKQVKAAHEHILIHLRRATDQVDLYRGDYLTVDDKGKIVLRHCSPGEHLGEEREIH